MKINEFNRTVRAIEPKAPVLYAALLGYYQRKKLSDDSLASVEKGLRLINTILSGESKQLIGEAQTERILTEVVEPMFRTNSIAAVYATLVFLGSEDASVAFRSRMSDSDMTRWVFNVQSELEDAYIGVDGEVGGPNGRSDGLDAPINRATLDALLTNDVFVPIDISLFRPVMQYMMGAMIFMIAGSETGVTLLGDLDFQLGNDVARKALHGNFTCRTGTGLYLPDNVVVFPNEFCIKHLTGGGFEFFDFNDETTRDEFSQAKLGTRSIFAVPRYPTEPADKQFMDITGEWPILAGTNGLATDRLNPPTGYAMAGAFRTAWNIIHRQSYFDHRTGWAPQQALNTLVCQGQQDIATWNGAVMDGRGCRIHARGHWSGTWIGDDCVRKREGHNGGLPDNTLSHMLTQVGHRC
jgi:hypothetical protein